MTRPCVYISGPITKGDQRQNVRNASAVFKDLVRLGFAPMCPHWSWFGQEHDGVTLSHDEWMNVDLPWVAKADAVFRIPGESTGADIECGYAERRKIPVFSTFTALVEWAHARE